MSTRPFSRKQFLALTASSAAIAGLLQACGESDPAPASGSAGSSGSAGTGNGGSGGGAAGTANGASGSANVAGSSSGAGGTAGGSGGSSAGSGGSGGANTGGAGGATGGGGGAGGGGSGGTAGGGGSGGASSGSCTADIMVTSSGGHTHTLLVTAAQLSAGTEVTILSGGSNGDPNAHKHYVKITANDFTMLKAGMEVKKKSCAGGDHEYVLKCGGGASAPGAPTCNGDGDTCGNENMAEACN